MKITSRHIADHLGISQSTVSLALRNDPRIKNETRKRIVEVADQMGYTPNLVSRSLVSGRTQTIAVLVGFRIFEHTGRMLSGMAVAAEEKGYSIKLMVLEGKKDLSEAVKQCVSHRIAGVIGVSIRPGSALGLSEMLARYHMPLVLLDSNAPELSCSHVLSDDNMGAMQIADHLVGLGHRQFAVITGHMDSTVSKRRTGAFWNRVCELLDDEQLLRLTEFGYHINDIADLKARTLLKNKPRPTALFCTTDFMAVSALRAARSMGLRIPEDISIVGYGNLLISELSDPSLTTVDEPFTSMGYAAMSHMLDMTGKPRRETMEEPEEIRLSVNLIVRQSTALADS